MILNRILPVLILSAYLKKLDTKDVVISEAYGVVLSVLEKLENFIPTIAEEFANNLSFDKYGNLWACVFLKPTVVETESNIGIHVPRDDRDWRKSNTGQNEGGEIATDSESSSSSDTEISDVLHSSLDPEDEAADSQQSKNNSSKPKKREEIQKMNQTTGAQKRQTDCETRATDVETIEVATEKESANSIKTKSKSKLPKSNVKKSVKTARKKQATGAKKSRAGSRKSKALKTCQAERRKDRPAEPPQKPGYTTHTIMLSRSHKPKRTGRHKETNEEKLNKIKAKLREIRESIKINLIENIKDQNAPDSISAQWSCLDLDSSEELSDRLLKLEKLHVLYGCDKTKVVREEVGKKKSERKDFRWNKLKLSITYTKKLDYSWDELKSDFERAWPKLGQLSARRRRSDPPSQYELWREFIANNIMVHRPLVQLIKVMLSCFVNSSDIERAFSFLAMICEEHRNRMLEDTMSTLFMLKVNGVQPKPVDEYDDVIKIMES